MAYVSNAEGNYFVQERLSEVHAWLTCTGVGDVDIPEGDLTPIFCPDPLNSGQFKIEGFIRGDKGAGTYSLTKPLANVFNFLMESRCAHQGRINWVCRGMRQDPRNYEFALLMTDANPSRRGVSGPVREPDGTEGRVNTNLDLSFIHGLWIYNLSIERQAVTNALDAQCVYFLPERCEDRCGEARGLCEEGVIGLEHDIGYLYGSEIKKTHNFGVTWAPTPTDPYGIVGGTTSATLLLETVTGARLIAFRGNEHVGDHAECAISLDWGVTWLNVDISVLHNQAVQDAALRGASIYACGSDGYIWVSVNQAAAWADSEPGAEVPASDLNAICFTPEGKGFCAGNANAFLWLDEQSNNWALRTFPGAAVNLLSVAVNLKGHVFVGTNDGRVCRSTDDGVTWTDVVDLLSGFVRWIEFDPMAGYVGAFTHDTPALLGSLYRSEDGGASWWELPGMPANNGLNDGFMCDQNNIYVVGNVHTTTFIAKTQPS